MEFMNGLGSKFFSGEKGQDYVKEKNDTDNWAFYQELFYTAYITLM